MSSSLYRCVGGPLDGKMMAAIGDQFRAVLEQIDDKTFRTGTYILRPFFRVDDGCRRNWYEWHFQGNKEPAP